jgi:hypothetical protein
MSNQQLLLLSKSNQKLKKDGIVSFGLPAIKTCPGAGACKKLCYACSGNYFYPNVTEAQARRQRAAMGDYMDFIGQINYELGEGKKRAKAVRIHDSGDFFNQEYLERWMELAQENPDVTFYAYTKSHMLDFKHKPTNLLIIGSMGSTDDQKLRQLYRDGIIDSIAVIFAKRARINPDRYVDCSESDQLAIEAAKGRKVIALRQH